MTTLFGFILFVCVAWWWMQGIAVLGFAVTLALIVFVGAGGWFQPYPYDPNAPAYLGWEGIALAVAIGFFPWFVRNVVLATWQRPPASPPGVTQPLLRIESPTVERRGLRDRR